MKNEKKKKENEQAMCLDAHIYCVNLLNMLLEIGVSVYFGEQGIHSIKAGSEFLISIFGSQAQAEFENLSANIRWGKDKAAAQGKVAFPAKPYGYRRNPDGTVEIVLHQAVVVRRIYNAYLDGDTILDIINSLAADGILSLDGKERWHKNTIIGILTNEKYAGDYLTNKTFCADCLTKKVVRNNGERVQYYIEDHHRRLSRVRFSRKCRKKWLAGQALSRKAIFPPQPAVASTVASIY